MIAYIVHLFCSSGGLIHYFSHAEAYFCYTSIFGSYPCPTYEAQCGNTHSLDCFEWPVLIRFAGFTCNKQYRCCRIYSSCRYCGLGLFNFLNVADSAGRRRQPGASVVDFPS